MPNKLLQGAFGIGLSAGSLSVLIVFLGRLWSHSYFQVLGLPTDDLTLSAEEFAFRTREAVFMFLIGAAVAALVVRCREQLGLDAQRPFWEQLGVSKKGFVGGIHGRLRVWRNTLRGSLVLLSTLLLFLSLEPFVPAVKQLDRTIPWRLLTILLGACAGIVIGWLITRVELHSEQSVRTFLFGGLIIFFGLVVLPLLVPRLARAAGRHDANAGKFTQAIIEFRDKAPGPIRSADDPSRSTRVHVLLSTPERLGVAFPFRCRTLEETSAVEQILRSGSQGASDLCYTLSFERKDVLAVRTITGSRPSNYLADRADELTLGPSSDATGPVPVHSEVYDLADSGRIGEETLDTCAGDSVPTDSRGVWFRILPQQGGRVTFPSRPNHYAFFTADRQTCLAGDTVPDSEENPLALKVNLGNEILIFLGQKPSSDFRLQRIAIEFEALRFESHDCDLAPTDSEEKPVGCGARLGDRLYGEFALEKRAEVTFQVVEDLAESDEDATDAAEPSCGRQPVVRVSGHLASGECVADSEPTNGSWNFSLPDPLQATQWQVTVCGQRLVELRVLPSNLESPDEIERPAEPGTERELQPLTTFTATPSCVTP